MLQHLTISHYALIEELDIDWLSGFSVITGETGAGKSIILGALNLLLGGRAEAKAIQTGHNKCMVEASFNIEGLNLEDFFTHNDIDYDPQECIVRREVTQSGKSRAFINDTPVTAAKLKEIGASLIDIHSQHQNLLIHNEHFLIGTLDLLAGNTEEVSTYKQTFEAARQAEVHLRTLTEQAQRGQAEKDYLLFQLMQLREAALSVGEQEELEQEQNLLSHAEDIKQAFFTAQNLIESEDCDVIHHVRMASEVLTPIADKYSGANELAERLQSVRIELTDIAAELEQHAEQIEYDPARLQFVEERLNTIYELEQKHHLNSIAELLDLTNSLETQLNQIETIDEEITKQQLKVEKLKHLRKQAADFLTSTRQKSATLMAQELTHALQGLGMPHVQLNVQITPRKEPDASGADKVTFLFSSNKNVPLQDISQIASGGEIARLMLALKALIARNKSLPTIIFDEIDTGVSGKMAESMAKVMQQISENCQVLCITHLPQIAALGKHHFRVYKEDDGEYTRSHICPLLTEERITEIAHMLSGAEITPAAMENARQLLLT